MAMMAVATLINDSSASDIIAVELVAYHAHIFIPAKSIPTSREIIAALDLLPEGFKRCVPE
jgi:hypothetical protein